MCAIPRTPRKKGPSLPHLAPPGRPTTSARGRVAGLAAASALGLGAACTDASHMFSGRWEAADPLTATWLNGRPELDLGHFGPEITGVIHYKEDLGVVPQDCACAFVEGDSVDLDGQVFIATTDHCGPTLIWTLTRVDLASGDPTLEGTVELDTGETADVTFKLVDTFVGDELKRCDEP